MAIRDYMVLIEAPFHALKNSFYPTLLRPYGLKLYMRAVNLPNLSVPAKI
jgi:hypothetical protein